MVELKDKVEKMHELEIELEKYQHQGDLLNENKMKQNQIDHLQLEVSNVNNLYDQA